MKYLGSTRKYAVKALACAVLFSGVSLFAEVTKTSYTAPAGQNGKYSSESIVAVLPTPGSGVITFQATSVGDIYLRFCSKLNPSDGEAAYNFMIGGYGNSKSGISRSYSISFATTVQKGLTLQGASKLGDKPLSYWAMVNKDTQTVSFGEGTVPGQNVTISYTDPNFYGDVQYVALSSWGTKNIYTNITVSPVPVVAPVVDAKAAAEAASKAAVDNAVKAALDKVAADAAAKAAADKAAADKAAAQAAADKAAAAQAAALAAAQSAAAQVATAKQAAGAAEGQAVASKIFEDIATAAGIATSQAVNAQAALSIVSAQVSASKAAAIAMPASQTAVTTIEAVGIQATADAKAAQASADNANAIAAKAAIPSMPEGFEELTGGPFKCVSIGQINKQTAVWAIGLHDNQLYVRTTGTMDDTFVKQVATYTTGGVVPGFESISVSSDGAVVALDTNPKSQALKYNGKTWDVLAAGTGNESLDLDDIVIGNGFMGSPTDTTTSIWACDVDLKPVNGGKSVTNVYQWTTDKGWVLRSNLCINVSVGFDETVAALNTLGKPFLYEESSNQWKAIPSGNLVFEKLAVKSDDLIIGVTTDNKLWVCFGHKTHESIGSVIHAGKQGNWFPVAINDTSTATQVYGFEEIAIDFAGNILGTDVTGNAWLKDDETAVLPVPSAVQTATQNLQNVINAAIAPNAPAATSETIQDLLSAVQGLVPTITPAQLATITTTGIIPPDIKTAVKKVAGTKAGKKKVKKQAAKKLTKTTKKAKKPAKKKTAVKKPKDKKPVVAAKKVKKAKKAKKKANKKAKKSNAKKTTAKPAGTIVK